MRAVSDRTLAEPYRTWIRRSAPLPASVRLLPRTIDVGTDAFTFLLLGIMLGGMGGLILFLPPWRFEPSTEGWPPYLFLAAIVSALWIGPLVLLRRLFRTFRARQDQERGALRQGVFLGPEGMLVRMEPNRCHAIASARFVTAKRFPPETSRDGRKPTVILETLDGDVSFFAERLAASAKDINHAASESWPSWSKPRPLVREGRKKMRDFRTPRAVMGAAYLFAGAMLLVVAATGGVIAVGGSAADASGISLVLLLALILLAGSAVNVFVRFLRLKLFYRCPECGAKAPRLYEALPAIHFYCPACNVEWTTGLEEQGTTRG